MADPQIGQGFNQDIAYRYRPGQTQAEFYSQKTGQTFGDANSLANYINTAYQGANATTDNVFGVLAGGCTPRAQALDQIKGDLNSFQQQLYGQPDTANLRKSSSITDSIASESGNYDSLTSEYNDLRKRLEALQSPNYQQAYNDLTTQQGIPQINTDLANTQKTIRELPYVNRMNMGNAGVATEGQLSADTQQKGIPLEIQQANLIDRLKLAQDFINNSLKFKEMDSNASRQSLNDALNTVAQTLNLSRTHLNDLLTQQSAQQQRDQLAQQFAYENRIAKPFYDIGGTVYRTSDRMPAHNQQEYIAMGGTGDFSDVQKIDISQTFENQLATKKLALDEKNSQFDNNIKLQQLKQSQQELNLKQQQFNADNGITNDTNVSLQGVMDAIGQYESGGNYQAIGKTTASGDKAYGKYQVMGSNIPSWTKTALGVSMTPQQFLNSPEAQDKVAAYYMSQTLNNYGTLEDVASVWFSGRPASKAGNAKDVNGTTVPGYIKNIQSIYAKNNPSSGGSVNPQVQAYAQQYASTGTIPTGMPKGLFNQVATAAKALPKPDGTVVDINTGVKPSKLSSTQEDGITAAYDLVQNIVPQLEEAFKKTYTGVLPGVLNSVGVKSSNMQHYNDLRTTFLNKLLLAYSGKVVSDKELARYQSLLPTSYSSSLFVFGNQGKTQLDDLKNSLIKSLDASLKTNGVSIVGYGSNSKAAQFDQ